MGLYRPGVVTVWVIQAHSQDDVLRAVKRDFDDEGESQASAFATAFKLGWYNDDFAEVHFGDEASTLLQGAAEYCRTLDEQAIPRLPEGNWNGLYLIFGEAGPEWSHPDKRLPMPHSSVNVDTVQFRLVDTFHIVLRDL